MSKCTSIILKEKHATMGDVLEVTIDGQRKALWFYSYADAMQYVGHEVLVEYRKDIYNGEAVDFIKTFTIPTVVQTLDKEANIKLYVDQEDNQSNLSFNEIADGETRQACVVFCTAQAFKSSNKATWMELIIRDKTMKTATCRIFDYVTKETEFAGKYIMCALSRSRYGFQTDMAHTIEGEVPPNPELAIAESFISNFFAQNAIAQAYIEKTQVIQRLKEEVDYEMGYGLVRLAMELSIIDSMKNITKDVDLDSIGCALLAQRGYLTRTSILSHTVNNVVIASNYPWLNKGLVIQLLDDHNEEHPAEYSVMHSVQDTVSTILKVRKGVELDEGL